MRRLLAAVLATAALATAACDVRPAAEKTADKAADPKAAAEQNKPASEPNQAAPPPQNAGPPPASIDAEAEPVVRALQDAMGGLQTWNDIPAFRFDFVVVRDGKEASRYRHWWDKRNGRARVEGQDEQGRKTAMIFRLADRKGSAFHDGIGVSDPSKIDAMSREGYERWVNDTYWVMMPFKLRDPGVQVRYARPERTTGATYDVLELSFVEGTGLTSDDRYWLFVNRETHLIDRWEYVLTGQKPPPSGSSWEAWTNVGPVKLSLQRRFPGKPFMFRFENVAVSQGFDESVFQSSTVVR